MNEISFDGNIVPHRWYERLILPNGKPDLVAITLLAEVTYWFRPTAVLDEATGRLVGWKQKFAGDRLRRSLAEFGDKFGLSAKQVRSALKRLRNQGLIVTELRCVQIQSLHGRRVPNIMFVEPIPAKIKEITFGLARLAHPKDADPVRPSGASSPAGQGIPPSRAGYPALEGGTYLENRKKSTHDIPKASKQHCDGTAAPGDLEKAGGKGHANVTPGPSLGEGDDQSWGELVETGLSEPSPGRPFPAYPKPPIKTLAVLPRIPQALEHALTRFFPRLLVDPNSGAFTHAVPLRICRWVLSHPKVSQDSAEYCSSYTRTADALAVFAQHHPDPSTMSDSDWAMQQLNPNSSGIRTIEDLCELRRRLSSWSEVHPAVLMLRRGLDLEDNLERQRIGELLEQLVARVQTIRRNVSDTLKLPSEEWAAVRIDASGLGRLDDDAAGDPLTAGQVLTADRLLVDVFQRFFDALNEQERELREVALGWADHNRWTISCFQFVHLGAGRRLVRAATTGFGIGIAEAVRGQLQEATGPADAPTLTPTPVIAPARGQGV